MTNHIYVTCATALGEGGLGSHMEFVFDAAKNSGHEATAVGYHTAHDGELRSMARPWWAGFADYTPLRWSPATKVLWESRHFGNMVSRGQFTSPCVIHTFPGYAEQTFCSLKPIRGVGVLEAATTHVVDVYTTTHREHQRMRVHGDVFSTAYVQKITKEYAMADIITVASTLQYDSFRAHGVPTSKLRLSPLGVDTEQFKPVEGQSSFADERASSPFRIVQVGQVSLRKGFHHLLEAVKIIDDPSIEVILVGGIGWRHIKGIVQQYRCRGLNITVAPGAPLPFLRRAHLCVHASLEDGFGLAPLEAMATGVPVIVTDRTGMKDVIRPERDGVVVRTGDVEALAKAIRDLRRDGARRVMLAKAAREASLGYDRREMQKRYAETMRDVWG